MKRLMLTFAAVFTLLGLAAPAAEAQSFFGPGYYGPRVYVGSPRYFYGPPVYGPGYVRVNPFYRPYANSCFRWRLTPTSIGPQWRMMNVCPQPAFVGPIYPYRRAFYY